MKKSDLRLFGKFLARNKLYTAVTLIGFAVSLTFVIVLGIYVTEQFSYDDFHPKKDRLYMLVNEYGSNFACPIGDILLNQVPDVENYTRARDSYINVKKSEENIFLNVLTADSSFFNMFGFELLSGDPSMVLSSKENIVLREDTAHRLFGDADPVGEIIQTDEKSFTVTGIYKKFPNNTFFSKHTDAIISFLNIEDDFGDFDILNDFGNSSFALFLLAREGGDLPSRKEDILEIFEKEDYWLYTLGFCEEVDLFPIEDVHFGGKYPGSVSAILNSKFQVNIYMAIAILILIISILNYINMTVAQSGFRGKESAIKKLMGSSKKGIVVNILYESLIMAAVAFLIGLVLAYLLRDFFGYLLLAELDLSILKNSSTIVLIISFVAVVGLLSGIIPALAISQFKPIDVVKGAFGRKVKARYSRYLIIFQYIIAIVLLTASLLIIQQFRFMLNADMGYDRDGVLVIENIIPRAKVDSFYNEVVQVAGVELVSLSKGIPMRSPNNISMNVNGDPMSMQVFEVDSTFFDLYSINITETGLPYTQIPMWANEPVVNKLLGDSTQFAFGYNGRNFEIAGTLSHFKISSLHIDYPMIVIIPMEENDYPWNISIKIAASADKFAVADKIKEIYSQFTDGISFGSWFAEDKMHEYYIGEKRLSDIMKAFTLLTIIIMIMGIFAMSLYLIRQKEKEIGIRKVNGATVEEIMLLINKSTIWSVIIAFVIAVPVAWYAISRWLDNFSMKIAISPWPFFLAGISVLVLTVITVSIQSIRTARKNPTETLKSE